MSQPRVLFLCTGNSCRSQMAEGWLRHLAGGRFEALSAGAFARGRSQSQNVKAVIADIAVDLYGLTACLSRTTRAIERKGEEGARREIELTCAFANMAERRLQANVSGFDNNDDEVRKAIAIPVTMKYRAGWDDRELVSVRMAQLAEDCGLQAVALHPRV